LTSSANRLTDGSFADFYRVTALNSDTASVTLTSSQFHPYLLVYTLNSDGTLGTKITETGNANTTSSTTLSFAVSQSNQYLVVANAVSVGATGAYALTFSPDLGSPQQVTSQAGGGTATGGSGSVPVASGTTISSQLTTSDPVSAASQFFKAYTFSAIGSDNATIEMQSNVLDCGLVVVQQNSDGSTTAVAINNGVNGNTHLSQVTFAVTQGAHYEVGVSTSVANETGPFTLTFSPLLGNVQLQGRAISRGTRYSVPINLYKEVKTSLRK